jgi:hypothetical protein
MAYTSYDAKDFAVVIDGVNITGLGEDMATGEKDEELNSFSVGAQGDVVESKINNTLGSLSVTVQRTCPQMSFLKGLANRTEPFPAWVTNKKLKERFGGSMAKLKSLPEAGAGAEAEDVTFEFQVIDYTSESI